MFKTLVSKARMTDRSTPYLLCDPKKVACPCFASVSSLVKVRTVIISNPQGSFQV